MWGFMRARTLRVPAPRKPPRAERDPGLCTDGIEFRQFVLRRYTAIDAKPVARTRIAAIGADFRRCQAAKFQHHFVWEPPYLPIPSTKPLMSSLNVSTAARKSALA